MLEERDIYLGDVILSKIKSELGEEDFAWYKKERVKLADGTYRETDYFLTTQHLIEVRISANGFTVEKYDRGRFKKVEKSYKVVNYFTVLPEKAVVYLDDDEENSLFLSLAQGNDSENIKRFTEFIERL